MTGKTWRRSGSAFLITFALVTALLLVGYNSRDNTPPNPASFTQPTSVPEPSTATKLSSSSNSPDPSPTQDVDKQAATAIESSVSDTETLLQQLNQDFQQDEAETTG